MIPKRVVLENFLSFGSPATEIVFGDDEPLWVLGGPNGVGKSAVFDAITYALFGCHRGGGQNAEQLVRHGSNGFRVVFDFEFNGTDYRITRSRTGRTTQKVERRDSSTGGWEPVANVNSAADVKAWAERTLGLGFDAFTASVLLRQGQADEILTATGGRRLAILKKIIGVERYEALSDRVHAKARECEGEFKRLRARREGLTPVTDAKVEKAEEELAHKETARSIAQDAAAAAAGRVVHAEQWVRLEDDRQRLEGQIAGAKARAAHADRIRTDYARLNDLKAAEQVVRQVVTLRGRLSDVPDALSKLRDEHRRMADDLDRLAAAAEQERQKAEDHRRRAEEHSRESKQLRKELQQQEKFLPTADEVAALKGERDGFPPDLADRLRDAHRKAQSAVAEFTGAGQARARVAGLLEQAKDQQRKFATVSIGVNCSRCGQLVSEQHARDEIRRLADEVQEREEMFRDAEAIEGRAGEEKEIAEGERDRLGALAQQQLEKSQRLADLENALAKLGVTTDAGELRKQLAAKSVDADAREQQARAEEDGRRSATREAERLDKERQEAATRLFGAITTERQRLTESGVVEDFQKLEQDAALGAEWVKRLVEVTGGIAGIPEECRVPAAEAERQARQLRQAALDADRARDSARATVEDLTRRAAEYRELIGKVAEAERQADLHRKLDDLLGKGGLQRELVRTAEREIVRLAHDTVQNLSDGDLAIELDDGADGSDEAFALRVRRADGPTPIGVSFLSGSQKFRVAIAVALAIGRFAAGQARPLESVIIDEGFGSLDRDGLRAAAEELHRLRQYLRRIVLVSHQEDFADRFPVVIRLSAGANGTTAEVVRR